MSGGRAPLVIVGPTAAGKSALAVALAGRIGGAEIVSADAMAVYRTMDVGTAKPTLQERAGIPHHLIDVVDPEEEYTVARFQADVEAVLADLAARDATPILVGGTGLYIRAVVDRLTLPGQFPEVRRRLEEEAAPTGELHRRLIELDPTAAARMLATNRRRIVRALEVTLGSGRPFSSYGPGVDTYPPTDFRQIGLRLDRDELDRRIDHRYERQLAAGFVDEVEALTRRRLSRTAAQALGYAELAAHLRGETTLDDALDHARRRTKRFARRQERWFRRDRRITWFEARDPHLAERVDDWWRKPGGEPSP